MKTSAGHSIFFVGDTHGDHRRVLRALVEHKPAAVIHLGDIQPRRPLEEEFAEVLPHCAFNWIHGNHDSDSETDYDHTFGSALADRNLHGRVIEINGLRVAGLGGNFMGRVWRPPDPPRFRSHEQWLEETDAHEHWRGGLPLRLRSAIFWDDYERLFDQRADVLVCHEAPGCHKYGYAALDELAAAMGIRLIVHGHHHERYVASVNDGLTKVYGVGLRGIADLDGAVILEGEQDRAREGRYKR